MNKKAIVDDMMFWIFRIILIIIVIVALVFFVNSTISKNLDTKSLELDLITARIINSKDCLARAELIDVYENEKDNVFRIYPGEIDKTKYNEEYLKKNCVILNSNDGNLTPKLGVKITLYNNPPVYISKDDYDDIEPLTFSSKYQKVIKVFPVLVYLNNKIESTTLEIVVVAKKR